MGGERIGEPAVRDVQRRLSRHGTHLAIVSEGVRRLQVGVIQLPHGGFGREQVPRELTTATDLPKLADALSAAGFGEEDVRGIMGENWRKFFELSLPA